MNEFTAHMRRLEPFSALQFSTQGIGNALESAFFGGAVTNKEVNK